MMESVDSRTITGGGNHPDPSLLLDLLHGLVGPDEHERLLDHLGACPDCEEEFRRQAAARANLRAGRRLVRRPDGTLDDVPATTAVPPARRAAEHHDGITRLPVARPSRVRAAWMLAAAAVLASALILAPWLRPDPGRSLLRRLPTFQEDIRFRSAVDALDDAALRAGLEAYAEGDYRRAAGLLRDVEIGGPFAVLRNLYLGSALAWQGDYGEAVAVLEKSAQGTLPDPWGSEARWTLYVALMGTGRTARADSVLGVLAGEPGEVGERARDRLVFLQRQ